MYFIKPQAFNAIDKLSNYKYVITTEAPALFTVKNDRHRFMRKMRELVNRHGGGGIVTNELHVAEELVKKYGGTITDLIEIKQVTTVRYGSELDEFVPDAKYSNSKSVVLGLVRDMWVFDGKHISNPIRRVARLETIPEVKVLLGAQK